MGGPIGQGYANLVYHTYRLAKARVANGDAYWQRFTNGNQVTLIQYAEQLEDPQGGFVSEFQQLHVAEWGNGCCQGRGGGNWQSIVGLG